MVYHWVVYLAVATVVLMAERWVALRVVHLVEQKAALMVDKTVERTVVLMAEWKAELWDSLSAVDWAVHLVDNLALQSAGWKAVLSVDWKAANSVDSKVECWVAHLAFHWADY